MQKTRAQGTIEYLVIIAIVVIIGLVVVSMMVGLLDQGSSVSEKSSKLSNWTNTIAITETSVNTDGNYLVRLANNSGEEITVTNVQVGDTSGSYSEDLMMSGAQNFVVNSEEACTAGEGTTKEVTITYVTKYGLTKTEVFPASTFFNCEEYNVSLLADQCEVCSSTCTGGPQILSEDNYTLAAGCYNETDLNTTDAELAPANILTGYTIFGITGTASAGGGVPLTGQIDSNYEDDDAAYSGEAQSYVDEGCGPDTVLDNGTGLCWEKDGSTFVSSSNEYSGGVEGIIHCEGLTLGNDYSDWRLPNINELLSLVDHSRYDPSINPVFTNTMMDTYSYWSSTWDSSGPVEYPQYNPEYWLVSFEHGGIYQDSGGYVRCVR